MREDGGSEVQRLLRVPKRISRRYRERDTSTIVVYPAFRKFCLKKDKLYDLMTNNSWRQITNLSFILQYSPNGALIIRQSESSYKARINSKNRIFYFYFHISPSSQLYSFLKYMSIIGGGGF